MLIMVLIRNLGKIFSFCLFEIDISINISSFEEDLVVDMLKNV